MVDFSDLTELALGAVTETLGEDVSYTPSGGSLSTVRGVFNARSVELDGGVPVMTEQPNLLVRISDFAATPAQGDAVTARATNYTVSRVDLDGEGGAVLFLREA